jgi:hypothetical protein
VDHFPPREISPTSSRNIPGSEANHAYPQ